VPDAIQREIDQYKREQDSIAQFVEEKCVTLEQARSRIDYVIEADYRVSNGDLYKAYKQFCEQNGEYLRSHRRLSQNMLERGFKQLNSGGRYWEGVKLVDSN
jgi:putative DNA primase/helicase